MFRLSALFFAIGFAHLVLLARGAPLHSRQLGNLECNVDRVKIVLDLVGAKSTVDSLTSSLSNTADASNIQTVDTAIAGAQGAIGVIGKALITGQTAPANAREQVLGNLTLASTTLAKVTSTDPTITSSLQTAQQQLNDSATAANGVIENCK